MRKITPFLLLGSILLSLVACQKETSIDTLGHAGGSKAEVGTWKLLSMRGITSQTIEFNDGFDDVKTVAVSDYTSINNEGTVKFDGSTMTGSGLAYSIDDSGTVYLYTNGSLDDSLEFPIQAIIPPTNSTATYKKIGTDSIFVQSGVFTSVGSGGATQSSSGGYKLAFDGDKMTMTAVVDQAEIEFNMGMPQRTISHAVQIVTLQKQ